MLLSLYDGNIFKWDETPRINKQKPPPPPNQYVCLLVWSFSSHLRIFHSFGDVTIADERLQILTYARYVWSLSSEGVIKRATPTVIRDILL